MTPTIKGEIIMEKVKNIIINRIEQGLKFTMPKEPTKVKVIFMSTERLMWDNNNIEHMLTIHAAVSAAPVVFTKLLGEKYSELENARAPKTMDDIGELVFEAAKYAASETLLTTNDWYTKRNK